VRKSEVIIINDYDYRDEVWRQEVWRQFQPHFRDMWSKMTEDEKRTYVVNCIEGQIVDKE
tara:strand:+ start:812 stop:991 length:180 start_codon:yes stop_codon:yes gene_type:complete